MASSEKSFLSEENRQKYNRLLQNRNNPGEGGSKRKSESQEQHLPIKVLKKSAIFRQSPIPQPQIILKNRNIEYQIREIPFHPNNYSKWSSEEHLFELRMIAENPSSNPLLINILEGINTALLKIMNILKTKLKEGANNAMVYIAIMDENIEGAIHSGGFNIGSNEIVNAIMTFFVDFLQSNDEKNLQLNDSFKIHFTVISPSHVSDLSHRGKNIDTFGAGTFSYSDFLVQTTSERLKNSCLITSTVMAYSNDALLEKGNELKEEEFLFHTSLLLPEENEEHLFLETLKVSKELQIGLGPHEESALEKLATYFQVQICIFEEELNNLIISYRSHSEFDLGQKILFLYSEKQGEHRHVAAIINLKNFFQSVGHFICILCEKTFKGCEGRHHCKKHSFCSTCWRPKSHLRVSFVLKPFICITQDSSQSKVCFKCKRTALSESCFKSHKQVCRNAFYCENCKRIIQKDSSNTKHLCYHKKCPICHEQIKDLTKHVCLMKKANWQAKWPSLVVAVQEDNNISLFYEKDKHGYFKKMCFETNKQETYEQCERRYLPSEISIAIERKRQLSPFGHEMPRLPYEQKLKSNSPMSLFLKELVTNHYFESSVILFYSKNFIFNLNDILQELIKSEIKPRTWRCGPRVIEIKLAGQDIRFLDPLQFFQINENIGLEGLLQKTVNYLHFSFHLQNNLLSIYAIERKDRKKPFIHPLGSSFCTNTSFIYGIFKLICVKEKDLYVVKKEFKGINCPSSRGEIKFVQWLSEKHPNEDIISSMSPYGQKYFQSSIPDAYIERTKEAFYYQGCNVHSCPRGDCPNRKGKTKNFLNKPDIQVRKEFQDKMERLRKEVPGIIVKEVFECEMNETFKKENFKGHSRTTKRLVPSQSCRGGRNEIFTSFCETVGDEQIYFYDMVSCYPFVAMNYEFPLGCYEIIIGKDLLNISFDEGKYNIDSKELFGLIQAEVLAPRNLKIPFLSIKINGKVYYTLCYQCAAKEDQGECRCPSQKRKMTSTWTSAEINFAKILGYKIKILEVYNYERKGPIFLNFIKLLAYKKLQYSGFPRFVITDEEKKKYVQRLNDEMGFEEPFRLSISDISNDNDKKDYYKKSINSFFGRFSLGTGKMEQEKQIFVDKAKDFFDLIFNKKVSKIGIMSDEICELYVKTKKNPIVANPGGNLIYNSFVTSYGRIELYKALQTLSEKGFKILYTDTDSIIFKGGKNAQIPLNEGFSFGSWRNEFPGKKIQAFYTLGLKNYALLYKEHDIEFETIKICGLKLQSQIINTQSYRALLLEQLEKIILNQEKILVSKGEAKLKQCPFTLQNTRSLRRRFNSFNSQPYGFREEKKT